MPSKTIRKEYRFNKEIANIIEQRNNALYPTETSFIEKAIYQMKNPDLETDVLILRKETRVISKKIEELLESIKAINEKLEVEKEEIKDGVSELNFNDWKGGSWKWI